MIDQDLIAPAGRTQRQAERRCCFALAVTGINLDEPFFQHAGIIRGTPAGIKRQIKVRDTNKVKSGSVVTE